MIPTKTKCKCCIYKNVKGNAEPCNIYSEINFKSLKLDNYFMNGSKNLMKED